MKSRGRGRRSQRRHVASRKDSIGTKQFSIHATLIGKLCQRPRFGTDRCGKLFPNWKKHSATYARPMKGMLGLSSVHFVTAPCWAFTPRVVSAMMPTQIQDRQFRYGEARWRMRRFCGISVATILLCHGAILAEAGQQKTADS